MSSSIHYTRKAITSNIFIREKILKKKTHFLRKIYHFEVTSHRWRVSFLLLKNKIFSRRLMRLNLRELVLKYKGRPIEWGLGAWARADRWCPHFKDQYATKSKKREILRNNDRKDVMIPWRTIFIWIMYRLNLRSLKGDCVLVGGDSLTLRLIISLYTNKIPFLISINENALFPAKICFKINSKSYSCHENHNFIENRIS